jgi:hypothetical protein
MSYYNIKGNKVFHKNREVRFFIFDEEIYNEFDDTYGNFVETDLETFKKTKGTIEIKRHTIYENGSNDICMTRIPDWFDTL